MFVGDIVDARPIVSTTLSDSTLFLRQQHCVLFTALNHSIRKDPLQEVQNLSPSCPTLKVTHMVRWPAIASGIGAQCLTYYLQIQSMVRASTVRCLCGRFTVLTTFATAGRPRRYQTPEPDRLNEVESTESAQLSKDPSLSRPVNGMYPLFDLITEQGSSGLGDPVSLYQLCLRSSYSSRQDCHRPTISPRIYQRALSGCLFFHYKGQLQNAG